MRFVVESMSVPRQLPCELSGPMVIGFSFFPTMPP
jgi:hypothetical protein